MGWDGMGWDGMGWDGMGWLWCSGDEQNELSGGRGSRWRPSGVERCGDFIGAGEGTNDPHGAVAALANREVDAEDAGEQTHPRQPMPGDIEQVPLERGAGVGGKLDVSLGGSDGELLGLGVHGVRGRDDSSAQGVPSACRRPRRASVLRHRSGCAPTTKPGWARPSPAGHRPRRPPRAVRFRPLCSIFVLARIPVTSANLSDAVADDVAPSENHGSGQRHLPREFEEPHAFACLRGENGSQVGTESSVIPTSITVDKRVLSFTIVCAVEPTATEGVLAEHVEVEISDALDGLGEVCIVGLATPGRGGRHGGGWPRFGAAKKK